MRSELSNYMGKEMTFTGVMCGLGHRKTFTYRKRYSGVGKPISTILIRNITGADGNMICDHLWLDVTPDWARLHPERGDVVEFTGTVTNYVKGVCTQSKVYASKEYHLDYTINKIHDISVVGHTDYVTYRGYEEDLEQNCN